MATAQVTRVCPKCHVEKPVANFCTDRPSCRDCRNWAKRGLKASIRLQQNPPVSVLLPPGVIYQDIPGFPNYKIGSDGTVWSRMRRTSRWGLREVATIDGAIYQRKSERPLGPYRQVALSRSATDRPSLAVHALIALAFLGPRPAGLQVRHLNGNGADNRLENLEYGTPKENASDREKHGRTARGSRVNSAKLTEQVVSEIIDDLLQGANPCALGRRHKVNSAQIYRINSGQKWTHIRPEVSRPVRDLRAERR